MRVQLRVSRPRVPVIERRRDDPDDVGLGDGAVPGIEAPARGGDLALQEGDYLGHGLMVRLDNQGLSAGVGDAPQRRDRLGDAEGEVVAGHRSPAASFELLGLDLGDRCRPLLVRQVGAQASHPRRDSGADRRVLREGSSERLARDWVLAHPEQERELALGHGVVPPDGPTAHGMQGGAQPSAWWRPCLGVVPRERSREASVAVACDHALEQVLVALAGRHHAHRNGHGQRTSSS